MKFYLPNHSDDRYSFRARGFLILETLNCPDDFITDYNQIDGSDLYIIGKKFRIEVLEKLIETSSRFVIDINDYKFNKEEEKNILKKAERHAVAFTTTCNYLADQIRTHLNTSLPIYVIQDPTERKQTPPVLKKINVNDTVNLIWYGSRKNLLHLNLKEMYNRFRGFNYNIDLKIITNKKSDDPDSWINWSYDVQEELVKQADFVFMPVSEHPRHEIFVKSKGNNRPIDAIQQGKYVITNNVIPSYQELKNYTWQGDVFEGLQFALENPKKVYNCITHGQQFIQDNYSPSVIANKWSLMEKSLK